MWDEPDFQDFIDCINGHDYKHIKSWLSVLISNPSGDPRVLSYLEALLDDHTLCILGIPYIHGEIRYLAAYALIYERRKQGIVTPVKATLLQPLTAREVGSLIHQFGIETDIRDSAFTKLKRLIDLNKAPTIDIDIYPMEEFNRF